mmetsp:Transcript_3842/g.7368  ORF Transcript_3842/g.7368 Transcript_3842/m.7368 type:complete len:81 (-) Transcript_3842:101-343(-)
MFEKAEEKKTLKWAAPSVIIAAESAWARGAFLVETQASERSKSLVLMCCPHVFLIVRRDGFWKELIVRSLSKQTKRGLCP